MADASTARPLERWLSVGSAIVAPVTLLSALLFYFGYVSSRARFRYFGVDVDTIGLGTRDYVMRSPQALLVPLLVIAIGGSALLLVHLVLRAHPPPGRVLWWASAAAVVVLVTGLVLLFGYGEFGDWSAYGVATPLMIATGVGGVVYTRHIRGTGNPNPGDPGWLRPSLLALALVVVATCLFWATATVAEFSGRGTAMRTARDLDRLPAVILDTKERLFLTDGIVEETALPAAEGQTFRYRYRGLRLLIQGDDRMFLVPERWSASNSTLVVPLDGSVRVRFQFVNRAP